MITFVSLYLLAPSLILLVFCMLYFFLEYIYCWCYTHTHSLSVFLSISVSHIERTLFYSRDHSFLFSLSCSCLSSNWCGDTYARIHAKKNPLTVYCILNIARFYKRNSSLFVPSSFSLPKNTYRNVFKYVKICILSVIVCLFNFSISWKKNIFVKNFMFVKFPTFYSCGSNKLKRKKNV